MAVRDHVSVRPIHGVLRLNSVATHVMTLGPSPAVALWVQGCHIGCDKCMSVDTWKAHGGVRARVVDVGAWLNSTPYRFVTLSGGEVTEQPEAVRAVLELLDPDRIVTMYSGKTIDELRHHDNRAVRDLLKRVDIAITGPYVRELHASLLWRGSSNQELINLSGRIDLPADDLTAGVSVRVGSRGLEFIGVPPQPDFAMHLRVVASELGGDVDRSPDDFVFPFPLITPKEK